MHTYAVILYSTDCQPCIRMPVCYILLTVYEFPTVSKGWHKMVIKYTKNNKIQVISLNINYMHYIIRLMCCATFYAFLWWVSFISWMCFSFCVMQPEQMFLLQAPTLKYWRQCVKSETFDFIVKLKNDNICVMCSLRRHIHKLYL